MPASYLIGVDLGTSATKAALYTADGEAVADASAALEITYPEPGQVEQDQHEFVRTAAETVRSVVEGSGIDPGTIAAIGFDSQMAGIGSVDEDFRPATRYDSWLDMRCQPYIEMLARDHGDVITRLTGCPPTCAHAAKMLWWAHERPDAYARIARFVTPSAFVAGTLVGLSGDQAFMDFTFLHFSGCSDAQSGDWSPELCDRLGIDREKLPKVVEPWQIIGETRGGLSAMFGLPEGIPVVAGTGDTAAAALGAGIVSPGMILDVAGTASVLAGCTDTFVADEAEQTLLTMRSAVPGLWHPLAFVGGGGLALDWFAELFATDDGAPADLPALVEEAGEIEPGADGLTFSPHLGGRVCPADPGRRGAWVGFSWGHKRAHFLRAALESIAYEYAGYLEILERLVPDQKRVEARVVGGGARSDVWNQIKAHVLAVPYRRLARSDIGTLGVALVAGHGVGVVDDLAATAARASRPRDALTRPGSQSSRYQPLIARYQTTQKALDPL
ncbi:FGGY-family carbohydrate kinase [Bauldia sp.]|uniref:FGGY-family carbohydrate kinase n=1 Tax=Bauldia sp. TaxID=2575872 RepID=UPI003BAD762A